MSCYILSDQTTLFNDCNTHVSSNLAAKIATSTKRSGTQPWTLARGTKAIQSLFKEMTRPMFGSIPCSQCDQSIPESTPYYVNEHIQGQEMTKEDIKKTLSLPGPCTYHCTVFHYAHPPDGGSFLIFISLLPVSASAAYSRLN